MFGERLKELRLDRNLKQKDIAQYLGVSRQAYGKYELGARQPDYCILIKIANYYNVSTDYILGKSNIKNIEKYIVGSKNNSDYLFDIIKTVSLIMDNRSDSEKIQLLKSLLNKLNKII